MNDLGADDTIEFLGRVSKNEMDSVYASADFQIVPLKDVKIFAGIIPSKFQAGMAHGVPVITTVQGDVTTLVRDNDLGFTATPEDVESLAGAFLNAYYTSPDDRAAMASRARQFYLDNFTRQKAIDQLERIFISVAKSHSDHAAQ